MDEYLNGVLENGTRFFFQEDPIFRDRGSMWIVNRRNRTNSVIIPRIHEEF